MCCFDRGGIGVGELAGSEPSSLSGGGQAGSRSSAHQDLRDRQLDVAIEEPQHAVHVVFVREAERARRASCAWLAEIRARVGEPACTRGAMHAIERARSSIVSSSRMCWRRQLRWRTSSAPNASRIAFFSSAVYVVRRCLPAGPGVARPVIEQDLVERLLAIGLADELERFARRADTNPRRSSPRPASRRSSAFGESSTRERTASLHRRAAPEPQPPERDVHLRHELVLAAHRGRIFPVTRSRGQIGVLEVLELRLGVRRAALEFVTIALSAELAPWATRTRPQRRCSRRSCHRWSPQLESYYSVADAGPASAVDPRRDLPRRTAEMVDERDIAGSASFVSTGPRLRSTGRPLHSGALFAADTAESRAQSPAWRAATWSR